MDYDFVVLSRFRVRGYSGSAPTTPTIDGQKTPAVTEFVVSCRGCRAGALHIRRRTAVGPVAIGLAAHRCHAGGHCYGVP